VADALPQTIGVDGDDERNTIALGNLVLHLSSYYAILNGRQVPLNAREFDLLSVLAAQAGRVIPFEQLAKESFGSSDRRAIRHLNVVVHRLRSKLEGLNPYALETVRFRGYGLLRPPAAVLRAKAEGPSMR
jgi:DNA-binding response OmpR family regulator